MALENLTETCEAISKIVNEWNSHDVYINLGMPNWQAQEAILDAMTNLNNKVKELSSKILSEVPNDPSGETYDLVKKYLGVTVRPEMDQKEALALLWTAMKRMDDIILTQELALKNFGRVK